MNILITGGTGFIGTALVKFLLAQGNSIILLTRNKNKVHNGNITAIDNLSAINAKESIDSIINLAGASISQHWTAKYKKILLSSRIDTTQAIIALIDRLDKKPELLISASAIGYYGARISSDILDETSEFKDDFAHQLCQTWENTANQAQYYGVRTCITRLGVVLGKQGGALQRMLPAFKLGLGGQLGDGKQMFSWIHLNDVIRAFQFFISNKTLQGVYNVTSPYAVSNHELTKTLGSILHRPTVLTMPALIVKIVFGEMGETLLLKGQQVIPKKLQTAGFDFNYPKLHDALENIFNDKT